MNLGSELARKIFKEGPRGKGAVVLALKGDLGAGKTTLIRGFLKEAGIERVTSPTFVLMKRYEALKKSGFLNIYHIDAYRLKNKDDLKILGWKEIVDNFKNIILIEWPERVWKKIPKGFKKIEIEHLEEGRKVIL